MSIIETIDLSKDYGGEPVFSGVGFSIEPGAKLALVGRNGCGKTTLVRILTGGDDDYRGTVRRAKGARVGYVPQKTPEFLPGETAAAFVCRDVLGLRAELDGAAGDLASADVSPGAMERYTRLRERYDAEDGDHAEENAARLLDRAGLGIVADNEAVALSGGEKNILALIRALVGRPELLVLDEPGNHLDVAGLAWLEEFIRGLPCAVLVVSHDRRMLDGVADAILELEDGRLTVYAGNYSTYRLEKLRKAAGQGQQWQADRKRLERLEALVRRFAEIARARPDPAWGKRLRARRSQLARAREEATERPGIGNRDARVTFLGEASRADLALAVDGYGKAFGERVLFQDAGFTVLNGERVALVGPNGCGKTSFIRDLVERGSWDDSTLRVGPSMRVGYCAQNQEVFDPSATVEDAFLSILPTSRDVLAHLGRFLFGYDSLSKRIGDLSGGELNRLQLARASALKANFLVLDEPTNHLDIPTREAVEDALAEFEGTVLVVSHDRYFLDKLAERVVFIEDRRFVEYEGGFGEYWRDVGRPRATAGRTHAGRVALEDRGRTVAGLKPAAGKSPAGDKSTARGESAAAARLEETISAMEKERENLERRAAAAFDARDYRGSKVLAAELQRHNARLEELWKRYAGQS